LGEANISRGGADGRVCPCTKVGVARSKTDDMSRLRMASPK
jgi:hypothetical protein